MTTTPVPRRRGRPPKSAGLQRSPNALGPRRGTKEEILAPSEAELRRHPATADYPRLPPEDAPVEALRLHECEMMDRRLHHRTALAYAEMSLKIVRDRLARHGEEPLR